MIEITDKELNVLMGIYTSEYQDGEEDTPLHWIWSFSVAYNCDYKGKILSGIMSSLSKKGLIVSEDNMTKDNDDPCCALTALGLEVLKTCDIKSLLTK